jgi:hypothetical protein
VAVVTDLGTALFECNSLQRCLDAHVAPPRDGRTATGEHRAFGHDFNNLLPALMGQASFIRSTLAAAEPLIESLRIIETAEERATELTDQLLAYSGR